MGEGGGVFDLLDLPPLERDILVYITRSGSSSIEALCEATGRAPKEISAALTSLGAKGRITISSTGEAIPVLGQIRPHTRLPSEVWPSLLTTERLYSEQDTAALRAAMPMLRFARARMGYFSDHGPNHALRVRSYATQMAHILGFNTAEQHLLRTGALFHDVGNVVERERHHVISQDVVLRLVQAGDLPFTAQEAEIVGKLCRWHRRELDPTRVDDVGDRVIHTGLMASILRIADAMDIDFRRSDYDRKFRAVLEFFFPDQLKYWTSLEEILGVRIRCTQGTTRLQVFTKGWIPDNIQIDMLRKDLRSTVLNWQVQPLSVEDSAPFRTVAKGTALLIFPFEVHSLVMAALSRKHLETAGYTVKIICYPDLAYASARLWRETLTNITGSFARIVIIGDRPDQTVNDDMLQTIQHLQARGTQISLLNRHEANWSRVPALLASGVEVILGGDWAYFWGDTATSDDWSWMRIAAFCTRDPAQSTATFSLQDQLAAYGLLKTEYDVKQNQSIENDTDWTEHALPVLERIADNDQVYFAGLAGTFRAAYADHSAARIDGRVIVLEHRPGLIPHAYYWALEAAIEAQGRGWEREIHFNVPYGLATWPDGDTVEVLAINHWREEDAVPIRLLYPYELGPAPQGNESTLRVRLNSDQASVMVNALIAACNRA